MHRATKYKILGINAERQTVAYDTSRKSAIINAVTPIMGGINTPPVDAQASSAAA
jgi:hypothetical protein